jgi:hypothetical protein
MEAGEGRGCTVQARPSLAGTRQARCVPVTRPATIQVMESNMHPDDKPIHEALLWQDGGWTARVIKNNDDDGWAVEMTRSGDAEPALTGPWTMGRDKKNPKPLDASAFLTLVKTASEVLRRHEQQLHARLHKTVTVATRHGPITVTLDIVPEDDDPHAVLTATDAAGGQLARLRVDADFGFTTARLEDWIENGYPRLD